MQRRQQFLEKISYLLRAQPEGCTRAVAAFNPQLVIDEIEFDFEDSIFIRHRRRRQTTRGNVQRYVPPVIDKRSRLQPNLADNLRPHVQCRERVLPFFEDEFGPVVGRHNGKIRPTIQNRER